MSHTTVKNDKTPDIFKKLDQLKKGFVTIGIHEDAGNYDDGESVVKVALWNEFGHVMPNGEKVPERSFFRTAIDDNLDKINKWREEILNNIFEKNWSVEKGLQALGLRIQALVQNKIRSGVPPENRPSTLAHKRREGRGGMTLVDTGLMLRSVSYKVSV